MNYSVNIHYNSYKNKIVNCCKLVIFDKLYLLNLI